MNRTAAYGVACSALTLAGVGALWPLLDGAGRTGVLVAAAIALPLQVAAFAALRRSWNERSGFLKAWLGGMAARVVAVAGAALWVASSTLPPAPTLLALVGLLFAMLLLEPFFLREAHTGMEARS